MVQTNIYLLLLQILLDVAITSNFTNQKIIKIIKLLSHPFINVLIILAASHSQNRPKPQ